MATTITMLPVQRQITSPVGLAITNTLEALALSYVRDVIGRPALSRAEISTALRAPVSMAAVLEDVCRWLEVETPPSVEDALG